MERATQDTSDAEDAAALARFVKEQARALGFHLVGITTAAPFVADERWALAWLEAGGQAEMAWLDAARARLAARPRELLPGARSVIVVGASYRAHEQQPTEQGRGQVG